MRDRRTNYDQRGVMIAHKDFYKIFEEGCSSRSQDTPEEDERGHCVSTAPAGAVLHYTV